MKYKAIIFDLDGTLLDTLDDLADAGNAVLAKAGLPVHSVDSYRYFVGDGLITLITRILPEEKHNEKDILQMASLFSEKMIQLTQNGEKLQLIDFHCQEESM